MLAKIGAWEDTQGERMQKQHEERNRSGYGGPVGSRD